MSKAGESYNMATATGLTEFQTHVSELSHKESHVELQRLIKSYGKAKGTSADNLHTQIKYLQEHFGIPPMKKRRISKQVQISNIHIQNTTQTTQNVSKIK